MTSWFFNTYRQEPVIMPADLSECQFQIRAATPADLYGVAQIITESFHSQQGIWGWAFPLLRLGIYEDLKHRLASPAPHHICLVAADTTKDTVNNLVGTVELGVRFSHSWAHTGRSFPYLSNLAVRPQYRRHGLASGLLKNCEKVSQEWGFQDLYLHVLENNHQARQLYCKLGYRVHKVESNWNLFWPKSVNQILLHKHLSNDVSA
ncbi:MULTISPECIES: GNAT family N-acetyltransferase [Calothrix]|uniref:GNAT family N-acetyltransferase n=2 Tax=Calothrix TaxID=1186 RepID=A0ABR8A839_9CYAN|nr:MULTISPECIES: GNAT family N-acetyltransferase [Calothrix]MBD2195630.1 GNAT family N-acetyltransferase [Calothrix parietina FACHB-288]MBD2224045.1 GNAT family N-acetyltransferase [Calothrix anomala FACHB-343]